MICPQVVFFDLCPFYYQMGFLHMLGRKFLEKIDKNCNRLCVTEKKKKQTMHVHYCTITKSKSNHGSFKPQISGIHVCIIIWKHIHKKKNPVALLCPVHTKVYYLFVKESTLVNDLKKLGWSVWNSIPGTLSS